MPIITLSSGWQSTDHDVLVLSSGDNHNLVVARKRLIAVPIGLNTRITGVVPPDANEDWELEIANGDPSGLLSIELPFNTGSDIGNRILPPVPGTTKYMIAPNQTVLLNYIPNADPALSAWYPIIRGTLS